MIGGIFGRMASCGRAVPAAAATPTTTTTATRRARRAATPTPPPPALSSQSTSTPLALRRPGATAYAFVLLSAACCADLHPAFSSPIAASVAAQEVCDYTIVGVVGSSLRYHFEGGGCTSDADCVNSDVSLDDDQTIYNDVEFGEGESRAGYDLGLFCNPSTLLCQARLDDDFFCHTDASCKSRVCRSLSLADSSNTRKRCIGRVHLKHGIPCASASEPCDGGRCWIEASSPITPTADSPQTYRCQRLGNIGDPCEILWTGTGVDARVLRHTCDDRDGDRPKFAGAQSYCAPTGSWRPTAGSAVRVGDMMSSGVCREVGHSSEGDACHPYLPDLTSPDCGWGYFCKSFPNETVSVDVEYQEGREVLTATLFPTKALCQEHRHKDEPCDSDDVEMLNGVQLSGCDSSAMCNLDAAAPPNPKHPDYRTGFCRDRFSLGPGEAASHREFCQLDEDDGYRIASLNSETKLCELVDYPTSCTLDADCIPATAGPLVPIYCDKAAEAAAGVCRPLIPPACFDSWKDWRNWHMGDRYRHSFSLRVRSKIDKQKVEALACCYFKEATDIGSRCVKQTDDVVRVVVPASFAASGIELPRFLDNANEWMHLEGHRADICSDAGLTVPVIITIAVMGSLLLFVFLVIVTRECCCKGRRKRKRREAREKRRADRAAERAAERAAAARSGKAPRNPLPPQDPLQTSGMLASVPPASFHASGAYATPPSLSHASQRNDLARSGNVSQMYTPQASPLSAPQDEPLRTPPPVPREPAAMPLHSSHREHSRSPVPIGTPVVVWYDGKFDGFHGWYDAEVVAYNGEDDSYDVMYTTNEVSKGVSAASVRLKAPTDMGGPPMR